MAQPGICRVCRTGLRLEECALCSGTGETRSWLVFHRICSNCRGTGELALCPNWANHWRLRQRVVPDPAQAFRKRERDEAIRRGGYSVLKGRMQGPPPPPPPPPSPPWWAKR